MNTEVPRGIRNNNPLNIRISENRWRGKRYPSTDPAFEQFGNMTMGIRAAMVCIRTYIKKYHLDTPSKIISRWAPKEENFTEAYIKLVCQKAVLAPDETISIKDKNKYCRLLWAMAYIECGTEISFQYFENAYAIM